ncbi:hypothetical protein IWW55_005802 [Coemansia sp. RSA 2706]|nr:hypothetical protein IWW55_005802 [Coemansia sp. RSA 2706]KAJ2296679.1 hypothetical protein IWW54_006914 [Coemansia sp. RSA 2705]KAJ2307916.1 hypothetical protein IWW52_005969 [Coemansia sp. RSA 2704]
MTVEQLNREIPERKRINEYITGNIDVLDSDDDSLREADADADSHVVIPTDIDPPTEKHDMFTSGPRRHS